MNGYSKEEKKKRVIEQVPEINLGLYPVSATYSYITQGTGIRLMPVSKSWFGEEVNPWNVFKRVQYMINVQPMRVTMA